MQVLHCTGAATDTIKSASELLEEIDSIDDVVYDVIEIFSKVTRRQTLHADFNDVNQAQMFFKVNICVNSLAFAA